MPAALNYPGVYIEEIPSGVRTIVGVSTSDTAFVDFFKRGPVNKPMRITSFGDFQSVFGGLDSRSEASYAIQQFYLNGGSIAWVVRVVPTDAQPADRTLPGGSLPQDTLTVAAASKGDWGNSLQVGVDWNTSQPDSLFNLVVREVETRKGKTQVLASETHRNLSMNKNSSRYAVAVVNKNSSLVQLTDKNLGQRPNPTGLDVIGNAKDGDFLPLGVEGGAVGGDGSDPRADAWKKDEGAKALLGNPDDKSGICALETIAPFVFNILCLPGAANLDANGRSKVYGDAQAFCKDKRAFLIVDVESEVDTPKKMKEWMSDNSAITSTDTNINAAVYFPRLEIPDALSENRPRNVGASGTLAGIFARTDSTRGVWKAPAGTDAGLRGATLALKLTNEDNGGLNPLGVNVLRNFPVFGNVSWGARTLDGADQQASEWKYIPVRRTALYIEESLYQGLKWVVFEPNDEPLWAQIRLNVGAFMHNLFRQGAFQGTTPRDAYFVKCDKETTTQNHINLGIVNIVVGFAPLKPAEFVIIKIQQMAGQIQT